MEPKPWWQSKTLWINAAGLVTAIGLWVQTKDVTVLGAAILSILNMVLRILTKQPLE